MAEIRIPDEDRTITEPDEIVAFLKPFGISYENWDVEGRVDRDAAADEVLAAYAPEIERLKESGGYVTADVIDVRPDTPGLDAMLEKFSKEHTHSEDEVRFIVKGKGLFHINPDAGPVFAVLVESGDLFNVPKGTRHWFDLCEDREIRAIRLFLDPAGWAPLDVDDPMNAGYSPLCWGPSYLPPSSLQ